MSRIPVFTRTVLPDRAIGPAAVQAARAEGDLKAAEFENLGRKAGQAFNQYAAFKEREQVATDTTAVNSGSVDFKMKSADLLQQQRDARNGNPDNFHKDFDTELTKLADEQLALAPTERAKMFLKRNLDSQRASMYEENMNWERTRKVELFGASVEDTSSKLGQLAYERGQKGEDISDLYRDADATTIAGSTFIAPEKIGKLNRQIHQTITEGRIKGLMIRDPQAAIKELDGMSTAHDSFSQADTFVAKKEGGYADNDGGTGAPVNFGINQKANPDIDVKSLTPEKAQEIRKARYWDKIGADSMSPPFAAVAYDGAINQGAEWMNSVKDQAQGDPMKLLDIREARYREIAKNPEKAKYLPGWLARLDDLRTQVKTQQQFVVPTGGTPENTQGMIAAGNIDLLTRPTVKNADGSISTVRSMSINEDGKEILIPTVSEDGRIMDNAEAIETYRTTGRNLGTFESVEAANKYAEDLHNAQANTYRAQDEGVDALDFDKIVALRKSAADEQERQIKLRNEDPVTYMQTKGDIPNTPLQLNAPDFDAQVQARVKGVKTQAANFGTPMQIFSKPEADYYTKQLEAASADQALGMLGKLRDSINNPRIYQNTLQQIRPDSPVTAMAGMYLDLPTTMRLGDTKITPLSVAENILKGERILNPSKDAKEVDGSAGKGGGFPMPKEPDLRGIFDEVTGDAFAGRPQEYNQAYQAYRAYYASSAVQVGDYSGEIDDTVARKAVKAITGGVIEKNDKDILLPWGMDEDVFLDTAESNFQATKAQFPSFFGGTEWDDVRLENTGEAGRYRMVVGAGYIVDAGGIPVTLKVGS